MMILRLRHQLIRQLQQLRLQQTTTPVDTTGLSFALTANSDVLQPNSATAATKTSANDDTVRGGADGDLGSGDIIDTGDGNDTVSGHVTSNSQTLAPSISNAETITISMTAADTKSFTLNATDISGADIINIKNAGLCIYEHQRRVDHTEQRC